MRSAYVRPIVFRGAGGLGVLPKEGAPVDVAIMALDWGAYLGDALEQGADVCVSSWHRPAPNTLPSWAKAGGNYLNSQLIGLEARRGGYDEGIALGHNGLLSEGAGENLFVIKRGKLLTPPIERRHSGRHHPRQRDHAGRDLGLTVEERDLPREALYTADEVFMTGTAAEITPVRSVDRKASATASPARSPARCSRRFFGLFDGRTEDRWGWLTPPLRSSLTTKTTPAMRPVGFLATREIPWRHRMSPKRCSRNSGTRTSSCPKPPTRRRCSTSTCIWCTK
jgi:branched-chain amino acid aminotransferase